LGQRRPRLGEEKKEGGAVGRRRDVVAKVGGGGGHSLFSSFLLGTWKNEKKRKKMVFLFYLFSWKPHRIIKKSTVYLKTPPRYRILRNLLEMDQPRC
jgi:hypothetical protein